MSVASLLRRRRFVAVVAGVAAVGLGLSGCAAGQQAQTAEQTSVVDGSAFQAGQLFMRDVGVVAPTGTSYAAGATAALEGVLINNGRTADQLVSVSSPDAGQVVFFTDGVSALLALAAGTSPAAAAAPTTTPLPTDSATAAAVPSPTRSPESSGTPTASGSGVGTGAASGPAGLAASSSASQPTAAAGSTGSAASTTPAAAPQPITEIPVAAGQSVSIGYDNTSYQIVLVDLKAALYPAQTVTLTFTFAGGGSVTAQVAVKLPVDATRATPTVDTGKDGE